MKPRRRPPTATPGWRRHRTGISPRPIILLLLLLLFAAGLIPTLQAEIQFDVFLGFDDKVREGHWFPASFEIHNDGPAFTGTVSVAPESTFDTQRRGFSIELPSGTRKRVSIPVFSANRYTRWHARLQDASGKTVAEKSNLQPRDIAAAIPILGAIPRSFGGLPTLPDLKDRGPEFLPAVARLQVDLLPSNPISYESLTAIYLNSEKATDLKPDQVDAVLTWLNLGGHLIVAIEQPTDANAVPWLRGLLPLIPDSTEARHLEGSFERWLVSGRRVLQLPSLLKRPAPTSRRPSPQRTGKVTVQTPANASDLDPFTKIQPQNNFNNAEMPVITSHIRDGETILGLGNLPLIQSAPRGRGTITALAFSPEREPFRSWKNRPWFWAKLIGTPPELLADTASIRNVGPAIDGLFGAMLDSRQVRKLPVKALLLLLVVYVAVIGPFDQWVLKRMGKPMWTWVTFPAYVVLFSSLIYFIGYRLRAGELEWNEIQVVDQLPRPDGAAFRGRTWASIYSPANARYHLASDQPFATLRAELQPPGTGQGDPGRLILRHPPHGIDADVSVPVWVSQLYCSDWLDSGPALVSGVIEVRADELHVALTNSSSLTFEEMSLAQGTRIFALGALEPGRKVELTLKSGEGRSIDELLNGIPPAIDAVNQRRHAFGSDGSGQFPRDLNGVLLASLSERTTDPAQEQRGETFTVPSSFDLNPLLQRGEAVLFARAPNQTLAPALNRFTPVRIQRDTVVRVAFPVLKSKELTPR